MRRLYAILPSETTNTFQFSHAQGRRTSVCSNNQHTQQNLLPVYTVGPSMQKQMQPPVQPLPYGSAHNSAEEYISSLLDFITTSSLHQALCGGVHVSDFLTRTPDLYSSLLPSSWRSWFADISIYDIIDLLLREDLDLARNPHEAWRGYSLPPESLLEFVAQIRDHTLDRGYANADPIRPPPKLDRQVAVGMTAKKEHEVGNFACFVSKLVDQVGSGIGSGNSETKHTITHLVDFGSGQNYLGRVLVGPMYAKNVIALESRPWNIEGARKMDVHAKLAKKTVIWRNKKTWKTEGRDTTETDQRAAIVKEFKESLDGCTVQSPCPTNIFGNKVSDEVHHRTTYIEHVIQSGNLDAVTKKVKDLMVNGSSPKGSEQTPKFMVMSLHSCGNLVHHGLRSLILNPAVKAVAMIGCCYNLCTERLESATFKLPTLRFRSANQRLMSTSLTRDPNGFPMSDRLLKYCHTKGPGIRFNITARMMAVQAPANWTPNECESFFMRHFYRALLQRIFLDIGFVPPPVSADDAIDGDIKGWTGGTEPIIIGKLSKACYKNFVAYVRGAVHKISNLHPGQGTMLSECMKGVTDSDIAEYEQRYMHKKHELCVTWSLMAFASQLVECAFAVDRWQFLVEQDDVAMAWVQTVFEYQQSPRNLAIIGVKK
ncbi:MAG: hypothetical protein GOMPHAMPRED_007966 [Gomphillus americanus]|uniref:Methyltransferase domain-containing protein n=1 Tax=Gomphillus americanus TaxID=1940652 RepID=A0A8H3I3F7_9LECA|nr:MAG: hypothetical protein GOMPHAMPRED_007966 [Gomphillus americanus]